MKISGIVIFAHILIIASLIYVHPPKQKPQPRKPVAVRTYTLQEEKPGQIPPKPVAEIKPAAEVSKPKPVAEQKPKPAAKPKPAPQAKPKPAAKSDPNHDKLVQMMQQSLTSLDHKPAEIKTAPSKQIGTLASEALAFETAYQDHLVAFLQNALTLPEKGDVKISLTVNRSGGVKAIAVKQAASEKNRQYVESTVPTLLLPAFDTHFKGERAHTFSITLTSS